MRNFVIAALAVFAFAGFVASAEARSKADAMTTAEGFAQELKSSGEFEIQSSTVALQKTKNEQLRNFAQKMIDDHTAADKKLTETLKQANLPEPKYALLTKPREKLQYLEASTGNTFERRYVQDQIQAHTQAVHLLETYSKRGDNDALKQLASNLLPTIKEHLRLAEGLQQNVTAKR